MNEEQRKQGANAKTKPNLEKDYSKYFEHVYQPPNLKDAKQRGKSEVQYHEDVHQSNYIKDLPKEE